MPRSTTAKRPNAAKVVQVPPEGFLTLAEFCALLKISRQTFYDWRQKGVAPRCHVLPNRQIRIELNDYKAWLAGRKDVA
ncbi:helix-turn-helix transcriptional regulator [Actinomadura hibisca]|uniref:helix-turn-helix transcriptional regulator n=1 Tax=Actinomadura hibisca TaxID=68565 RepID=UPI0008339AA6|nr:helix-turn-helix domain-containing protein [Actinomadura hibisca]